MEPTSLSLSSTSPIPGSAPEELTAHERQQLHEAAKDFEALLLNMLLRSMRSTIPESSLFGDSSELKMYEELRDENLAAAMAESRGLGLAPVIERQLGGDPDSLRRLRGAVQSAKDGGIRATILENAPVSVDPSNLTSQE